MRQLIETNRDYARALLLVAMFLVGMTALRISDGLQGEAAVASGVPAVSSVEIEARSTLK